LEGTAKQDWAKIKELLYVLQGMEAPIADEKALSDALLGQSNRLGSASAEIVQREAETIRGIADEIVRRMATVPKKLVLAREEIEKIPAFAVRFKP
jgi:hypothetical protein